MTKDFSDAPLTVDGITIKPKWKWSKQYRAEAAASMVAYARTDLSMDETEDRYVQWYAGKHGLTHEQARKRVEAMK